MLAPRSRWPRRSRSCSPPTGSGALRLSRRGFSLGFRASCLRSGPVEAGANRPPPLGRRAGTLPESDEGLVARARGPSVRLRALVRIRGLLVTVPGCTATFGSRRGDDWAVDAVAADARPCSPEGWRARRTGSASRPDPRARQSWRQAASGSRRGVLLSGLATPDPDLVRELGLLRRKPAAGAARRPAGAGGGEGGQRAAPAPSLDRPPIAEKSPSRRCSGSGRSLPEGFPGAGAPQKVELSARILNSRARAPIGFRLYCGSVRLAEGRTRPGAATGEGRVHRLRASGRLDPAVAAAAGGPPLSLYFGRRSRASSPLGPDAVLVIDRVR